MFVYLIGRHGNGRGCGSGHARVVGEPILPFSKDSWRWTTTSRVLIAGAISDKTAPRRSGCTFQAASPVLRNTVSTATLGANHFLRALAWKRPPHHPLSFAGHLEPRIIGLVQFHKSYPARSLNLAYPTIVRSSSCLFPNMV